MSHRSSIPNWARRGASALEGVELGARVNEATHAVELVVKVGREARATGMAPAVARALAAELIAAADELDGGGSN